MAGWCHWLDRLEFEWTLGVGDGQGGLACCNSWGRKESDTTEQVNWTEHWRIDAFNLWCWRRLLRVPCTARKSNQSILREIDFQYSLEGLMLKLKFQYFSHLIQVNSLEKTLMLGKIEGRREGVTEDEMIGWHHQLNGHEFEYAPEVGDGQGSLAWCSPWGHKESDLTEQLNWYIKQDGKMWNLKDSGSLKFWRWSHKWSLSQVCVKGLHHESEPPVIWCAHFTLLHVKSYIQKEGPQLSRNGQLNINIEK